MSGPVFRAVEGQTARDTEGREEARRARRVRWIADVTQALILQDPSLTPAAAAGLIESARAAILELFPEKEEAYRWIYEPRLRRAVAERWPDSGAGAPPGARRPFRER